MPSRSLLPALGEAASGAAGAAIATAATYPLDLVNTRLKVQRQLPRDQDGSKTPAGDAAAYDGVLDGLRRVLRDEGGPAALFVGLGSDAAKSAADSFLFFLFYSWIRSHRLSGSNGSNRRRRKLRTAEELLVGAVAGACSRALTMPVANAVARMQTAALTDSGAPTKGLAGELRQLWRDGGVRGLWAGYSAALVLTLNPSVTFCLDQALRGVLASQSGGGGIDDDAGAAELGGAMTFLSAAVSKAAATALTYPFQVAKARLQVSSTAAAPSTPPRSPEIKPREQDVPRVSIDLIDVGDRDENKGDKDEIESNHSHISHMTAPEEGQKHSQFLTPQVMTPPNEASEGVKEAVASAAQTVSSGVKSLAEDNIFTTVARIAKSEGPAALYDGLAGELLKAFFSHGITMLSKDLLHKLVVRLYFVLLGAWRSIQGRRERSRRDEALLASFPSDPQPSSSFDVPMWKPAGYAGRYPTGHAEAPDYRGDGPAGYGVRGPAGYLSYRDSSGPQSAPPHAEQSRSIFGFWRSKPSSPEQPSSARRVVKEAAEVLVANMMDSSHRLIKDRS